MSAPPTPIRIDLAAALTRVRTVFGGRAAPADTPASASADSAPAASADTTDRKPRDEG